MCQVDIVLHGGGGIAHYEFAALAQRFLLCCGVQEYYGAGIIPIRFCMIEHGVIVLQ